MKKILITNLLVVGVVVILSLCLYGGEITLQYWLCDYIGIVMFLTAQKLLKKKQTNAFPIYILGLIFNIMFGIIAKSVIVVIFSLYSILIFIENWKEWKKDEAKVA